MVSVHKLIVILPLFAGVAAAADTPLWELGKVVAVEPVSTPAKTPDASCRNLPRGSTPPAQCRPSYLRAQQFWRVTVEVGNRRFVVRPYRTSKILDSLNSEGPDYFDPKFTAGSSVEVAIISIKSVRFRTGPGHEFPAMVDSQELLANSAGPASARPEETVPVTFSASKVVLLQNSDFIDLEVQGIKSQDIGDGAVLYLFTGDTSPIRAGSNTPVLLVLAEHEADAGASVDLSRLQVGKGTRQLVYSVAKKRSASSVPIVMTQVSATLRKFTVKDPLPRGEYVVLLENSGRGFLFSVR